MNRFQPIYPHFFAAYMLNLKIIIICFIFYINLHFHLVNQAYHSKIQRFARPSRGEQMYFLLLDIANFELDKFLISNFSKKINGCIAIKINFKKCQSRIQTNTFYSPMHADHTSINTFAKPSLFRIIAFIR